MTLRWGSGLHHDDTDEIGLYATRARQRLDTVRRDRVRETSINANLEALVEVTEDLCAGVFNALDSDADDIAYYCSSRLPGEPAGGVEDRHFHPLEPRAVRASIAWHFGT